MASGTANTDPHSNQTTLIGYQASHRLTVDASIAAARVAHVDRNYVQAVHVDVIFEGRRPPVTAATLTARGIIVVDARQRRR